MTTGRRASSSASTGSARRSVTGQSIAAHEVKFAGAPLARVSADGAFEGYASLFNVVDLGRDQVISGAFTECLAHKSPQAIKLLWQHDPAHPLGVWQEIVEDARGLKVRGKLDLAVAKAREVHALMRSGAVDGLSIGFRTERSRKDPQTGVRRLEKLDLWEVSVVTFPMLPGARVSSVKRLPLRKDILSQPGDALRLANAMRRSAKRLNTSR